MNKVLILLVVIAQVGVLAYMAGEREWVARTGRTVYLRTAPVDPRDPMRGDYLRLSYEMGAVPREKCRDGIVAWFDAKPGQSYDSSVRDRRVYASIRLDSEGVAELVSLSDRPPADGLYLRGRANAIHAHGIDIRFGVEALFMQQGKAKDLEAAMRTEKAGVPLNMQLAVSPGGLAVLQNYRWEPLGITVTLDQPPPVAVQNRDPHAPRTGLRGVTVELKNHSSAPVAIIDGPDAIAFRLNPSRSDWNPEDRERWEWAQAATPPPKPTAQDVKVLQPGESHRVHLDFTASHWFVRKTDGNGETAPPTSLENLAREWGSWFRIEYAPPPAADCAALPHADLIRHTAVRSRIFSPAGSAD